MVMVDCNGCWKTEPFLSLNQILPKSFSVRVCSHFCITLNPKYLETLPDVCDHVLKFGVFLEVFPLAQPLPIFTKSLRFLEYFLMLLDAYKWSYSYNLASPKKRCFNDFMQTGCSTCLPVSQSVIINHWKSATYS